MTTTPERRIQYEKRLTALAIVFAIMISISPAVIADDNIPRPTVEEILSEYHQKAFEAEIAGEESAAAYSPRSGSSGKTLEQETVDTLNAAGYEAYNVTAENYEELETQLQTDFGEIGLDPLRSYLIVIHTEKRESAVNGSRVMVPVKPDITGECLPFNYTYNGVTYTMRYLTITPTDNPDFLQATTKDLLLTYGDTLLNNLLNTSVTLYADAISGPFMLGTLFSLFGLTPNFSYTKKQSALALQGLTNWTRNYVQVWDEYDENWIYGSCSEYAVQNLKYTGLIYNSSTNTAHNIDKTETKFIYSSNYHNTNQQKIDAVLGYLEHDARYDITGNISYYHGTNKIFTHYEDYI